MGVVEVGVRSQGFLSELKVGDGNCWVSFDYNKTLFSGQPMMLANSPAGHRACGEIGEGSRSSI